jgi:twitching motility two-component system response regulator PilH
MTPTGDLRSVVQTARRILDDLAGLLASIETLALEQEQAGARGARLEQQHQELLQQSERVRRERDDVARSLAELRAAHDALLKLQEARRHPGQPHKVMIVDDATSDLRAMESMLRAAGHEVVTYGDGEDIEEKVATQRPDLLLLDIVLPHRNGYEILRALKRDERTRHTPVVIVTGRSQESDRVWSRRQGADEYVTKPFTAEQLLTAVQRLIG